MPGKIIAAGLILFSLAHSQISTAQEFSANIGWNSEYIYRGIPQKTSSAFGGADFEAAGFNLGVWGADVGDGIEVDYYGGYGVDVGDFSLSIGGTWYTYTGNFDDEYLELNLGAGWHWLSLDVAIGQYDNFNGPTLDYQFYALSASHKGFYGKAGIFRQDFDGSYYEAGYADTLQANDKDLFDYSFALIYSDSTLLGGESDTNLVLTLSKTFR